MWTGVENPEGPESLKEAGGFREESLSLDLILRSHLPSITA